MHQLKLEAENCYAPKWKWTWKVRIVEQRQSEVGHLPIQWMTTWCGQTFGASRQQWSRDRHTFFFRYKEDAMLFKLTWHGRDV